MRGTKLIATLTLLWAAAFAGCVELVKEDVYPCPELSIPAGSTVLRGEITDGHGRRLSANITATSGNRTVYGFVFEGCYSVGLPGGGVWRITAKHPRYETRVQETENLGEGLYTMNFKLDRA